MVRLILNRDVAQLNGPAKHIAFPPAFLPRPDGHDRSSRRGGEGEGAILPPSGIIIPGESALEPIARRCVGARSLRVAGQPALGDYSLEALALARGVEGGEAAQR